MLHSDEEIYNFTLCLPALVQKLEMYGDDNINEERAIKKLMCVVSDGQ